MRKINPEILQIHVEDAGFVLSQREIVLEAPNYRLIDIYDLEQRLNGHLDALVLAGEAGAQSARTAAAEGTDAEAAAVLLHVALRLKRREDIEFAVAQAGEADDLVEWRNLIGAAAAWCPADALSMVMGDWITSQDPMLRWIALDVCGRHRVDPKHHLKSVLVDEDAQVRARALQLAGEVGRTDVTDAVRAHDGPVADLALILLGDQTRAEKLAEPGTFPRDPATARRAAELFPLGMDNDTAQGAIRALIANPETRRWGIVALGAAGSAQALPSLIGVMENPLDARVAVSAFEQITGLYLAHAELELEEFPDDPEDPAIKDDACEALIESNTPWPDPPKVEIWFGENAKRFPAGERLLFGAAAWSYSGLPDPWLRYQARHRGVALTQAMGTPEASCPNWRSPVFLDGRQFARAW